jgi:multicomponent Na+:H+ antiporter subunit C
MMRRNFIQLIIGLGLLSHGANLLIFTAGGLRQGGPPILAEGEKAFEAVPADPLPQALILTAIVISFAVTAFALVLFLRTYQTVGTDDVDELRETDT